VREKKRKKKMKIAEPDWIKARSTGTAICRWTSILQKSILGIVLSLERSVRTWKNSESLWLQFVLILVWFLHFIFWFDLDLTGEDGKQWGTKVRSSEIRDLRQGQRLHRVTAATQRLRFRLWQRIRGSISRAQCCRSWPRYRRDWRRGFREDHCHGECVYWEEIFEKLRQSWAHWGRCCGF